MNGNVASYLALPSPCGLAITSVASDGEFLYALSPDKKAIYKLDVCGRIICVYSLSKKYISIYYCGGKFYAVSDCDTKKIYVLNKCFHEISKISPDFSSSCNSCRNCGDQRGTVVIGPAGECTNNSCMLTIGYKNILYAADSNARPIATLSTVPFGDTYTAIAENGGILFEAIEKSGGDIIRATLLSSGQTKVQRLPAGYKIRSFFCFGGYLYAFFTKNSFHGFVAPVCTFISSGNLCGEIIPLPDVDSDFTCDIESCGTRGCAASTCDTCDVSSNAYEFCSSVSGDSIDNDDCDIKELCRLFDCIKKLCKGNSCQSNSCGCGCGSCVSGESTDCNCRCFPKCEHDCTGSYVSPDSCLPLPPCPQNPCCAENVVPTANVQVVKK